MAITYRSVKGSALTHTELDANFSTLVAVDAATDVDVGAIDTRVTALETTLTVVPGSASVHLSSDATQTIAIVDTPQVVTLNTHDDTPLNITHSVSLNSDRIEFDVPGRHAVIYELQVHNGSGSATLYAWMQESTDGGTTWVNIANSAIVDTLSANTENVVSLHELYDATAGDMVRMQMQGDSTNLDLDHRSAFAGVPATPSVIASVYLVGPSA